MKKTYTKPARFENKGYLFVFTLCKQPLMNNEKQVLLDKARVYLLHSKYKIRQHNSRVCELRRGFL